MAAQQKAVRKGHSRRRAKKQRRVVFATVRVVLLFAMMMRYCVVEKSDLVSTKRVGGGWFFWAHARDVPKTTSTTPSELEFEHEALDSNRFPGWLGEKHRPAIHKESKLGTWVEPISWEPRAFVLHDIMSEEECEEVLRIAKPLMKRSTVVDSVTGEIKVDPIRTSRQTFLQRGKYPVVTKVEERLERFTLLPWYNGEDMQILSYGVGEKYSAHHDVGEKNTKSGAQLSAEGGHRVATVLLYLEDTEEGGETAFPDSDWIEPESEYAQQKFSKCAENGVAFKPKRGDGLLFFSITPEGDIDQRSMHSGCPVVKGEKWTMTKWIHARPFHHKIPGPKPPREGCENKDPRCKGWANAGECEKNPGFMTNNCKWACRVPGCEHKGN